MIVQPYLLGSGRAAQALLKSLYLLKVTERDFHVQEPRMIGRTEALQSCKREGEVALLFMANPHGLHAQKLLEAEHKFDLIVCEKPVCTNLEEVKKLRSYSSPVAVCHVYRQMWGPQTLKQMIQKNELGDIISIEGRYWQSSAARRSLAASMRGTDAKASLPQNWKNDPFLSGGYDALLDIGTHWADAALFLSPQPFQEAKLWLSYKNAEAKHRDTHLHMDLRFEGGLRAWASISKTVHGAPNYFEINVIGSRRYAAWNFLQADEISIGEGSEQRRLARSECSLGSLQDPFHGVGWLEGYIEILRRSLGQVTGKSRDPYPNLSEGLQVVEALLQGPPAF